MTPTSNRLVSDGVTSTPVPMTSLGGVTTDGVGRYSVSLRSEADLNPYEDSDKMVNMTVIAYGDNGGFVQRSFAAAPEQVSSTGTVYRNTTNAVDLRLDSPGTVTATSSAPSAKEPVAKNLVAARSESTMSTASVDDAADDSFEDDADATTAESLAQKSSLDYGPVPSGCIKSFQKDLGARKVFVGGHYDYTDGVSHWLSFKESAQSEIGIGVSASGAKGTFSASGGTKKVKATDDVADFARASVNEHDYTSYRFGLYKLSCGTSGLPNWSHKYLSQAYKFAGGGSVWQGAKTPAAWNCVPLAKGLTYKKSTSRAWTNTIGAKTGDLIGVDVSAQAGYSGEVTVGFQFWSKSGLLCGTKDDPGGKPGLLVARATK